MPEVWKRCSSCKKEILTGQTYYVCSISTCQGRTTNYAFCSIPCWDAHVPTERHKPDSAGAIERKAPQHAEPTPAADADAGQRRIVPSSSVQRTGEAKSEDDILVVVSKVRKYIADKSGMNTSAGVYAILTERIKRACDLAIEEARRQGRKTVMDRDVP